MDRKLNELLRSKASAETIHLLGEGYDYSIDKYGALCTATWYSCSDFVRHAVSKGASVNKEGPNGTPLGIAASMGDLTLTKFFLERGASLDQIDKRGRTALACAAGHGKIPIVKLLIKAGADLAGALSAATDGSYENVVKLLLDAKAPVNEVVDPHMAMPPLLLACAKGKKKGSNIALLLLDAGADASYVRASDGMSAMKFALWGQCDSKVFSELERRGAPLPDEGFPVIRLA